MRNNPDLISRLQDWPRTPAEARVVQASLANQVCTADRFSAPKLIAGVDVSYQGGADASRGAVAVLAYPSLAVLEESVVETITAFPYVPGFLSFREIPPLLEALSRLKSLPDMLVCDGQGLAHPRRFGLACHLGVLLDLPVIGVAKSRLIGTHAPVGPEKGDHVPLMDKGETVGMVVRTRAHVAPVYVSVGHRVSLETAVEIALSCCPRWRLPETTRAADALSKAWKWKSQPTVKGKKS
ncbi:MAG: deoxyribonuclease V [Magnetospiraceae bacterium]